MKKYVMMVLAGAVITTCAFMFVTCQPLPKVEFEPPVYTTEVEEPDAWDELVAMMDYDWAEEWEKRKAEEAKK